VNKVSTFQIPRDKVIQLKLNEMLGFIGGHILPITCDSGANVTVVPEECVQPDQFTGEMCSSKLNKVRTVGKKCCV